MQVQQITTMDMVTGELVERRHRLEAALGITAPDAEAGAHGETEHLVLYEQRQLDEAIAAMMRTELEDVCRALARIGDGTYGTCVGCGRPIPEDRLLAVPATSYCIGCGANRRS